MRNAVLCAIFLLWSAGMHKLSAEERVLPRNGTMLTSSVKLAEVIESGKSLEALFKLFPNVLLIEWGWHRKASERALPHENLKKIANSYKIIKPKMRQLQFGVFTNFKKGDNYTHFQVLPTQTDFFNILSESFVELVEYERFASFKEKHIDTKIEIYIKVPIFVDLTQGTCNVLLYRHDKRRLATENRTKILFMVEFIDFRNNQNVSKCDESQEIETWLLNAPVYSKEHFGFSVYYDDTIWTKPILNHLISNSPTMLIENKNPLGSGKEIVIGDFLRALLAEAIIANQVETLKITIKVNLDRREPIEALANISQLIVEAGERANREIFPGIIDSVIFGILDIAGSEESFYWTFVSEFDIFIELINTSYSEKKRPKLGIHIDYETCNFLKAFNLIKSEIFLVKSFPVWSTEQEKCVGKTNKSKQSLKMFKCEEQLRKWFGYKKECIYQIYPTCNEQPTSDISQTKHRALALEDISREATSRNSKAFWNNAFQYRSNFLFNDKEYNATCGWWVLKSYTNLTSHYIIEDKYQIAKRFWNEVQKKQENITSQSTDPSNTEQHMIWWTLAPVVVVLTLTTIVSIFLTIKYRSKYILKAGEIKEFFKGKSSDGNGTGNDMALSQKYNKEKYEIPESKYVIDKTILLGSGEFGVVFGGTIETASGKTDAAVKATKNYEGGKHEGSKTALRGLMCEIKILTYLGNHENIVKFLGAFTGRIKNGQLLVFLEWCENGSLFRYLRDLRPPEIQSCLPEFPDAQDSSVNYDNMASTGLLDPDLSVQFLRWATQIASGMEYLVSKQIVHADLATRNILLSADKIAKISDFGLSRRLYNYSQYIKSKQEPLPWRWMAPEALGRLEFGEKTDVWAYGITLWEIYSLAETPYAGMSWTVDLVPQLEAGLKLSIPKYNEYEMYTLMIRCWNVNSGKRPTFSKIREMLRKLVVSNEPPKPVAKIYVNEPEGCDA